jgi:exodeoxyribonuclease VII large subunit
MQGMYQDDLFSPRQEAKIADPEPVSVTELNRRIKRLIEQQCGELWVEGEVSNYRPAASGHIYFTLKDEGSQIPVALFKGQRRGLKCALENGLKVRVFAEVTLYLERGQHQLIARVVEAAGLGDLQRAFEALKEKLRLEGLFDAERKRPLPFLPRHIGIVTSPTGAAIRDMLNVLGRRFPNLHIVMAPVKVQGDGAAAEIAAGIDALNRRADLDVLIIGRGGGSLEDLWAFNEEVVARAIARSRLPVISAVGHEIDFTISDFVADLRAPTPSAAAELVVRPRADIENEIRGLSFRLGQSLQNRALQLKGRLIRAARSYVFHEPRHALTRHRQTIAHARQRMVGALRSEYAERQQRVDEAQAAMLNRIRADVREKTLVLERLRLQLRALDPRAVLERGYSITRRADGRVVTCVTEIKAGEGLVTLLRDGHVESTVTTCQEQQK